jgi:rubrerythrin
MNEQVGDFNDAGIAIQCLVAAERAVDEGRFNLAKVLRAVAHAFRVDALATARNAASRRRPVDVLASVDMLLKSQTATGGAMSGSATTASLVSRALASLERNRDVLESDVAQSLWGCQVCGEVVEGPLPTGCPRCGALPFEFEWFGPFYSSTYERLGRLDPVQIARIVAESPDQLSRLVSGLSDERLSRRPSADEWCMKEIAGHLVDVTEVFCHRVRVLLQAPAPPTLRESLPPWRILEGKGYAEIASAAIVQQFGHMTADALTLIRALGADGWGKFGLVGRRVVTVLDLGGWLANHNIAHFAQIAALRDQPGPG